MELRSTRDTLPNLLNSKIRSENTLRTPASVTGQPPSLAGPLQSSVGSPGFQGAILWSFSMCGVSMCGVSLISVKTYLISSIPKGEYIIKRSQL